MKRKPDDAGRMFAEVSLGAPDNAVGFVLWRVVHRYQREVDRVLSPTDLTHLQFTTLAMAAWLGQAGRQVTQAALAEAAEIHPMQVSQMLKALEAKDMVGRPRNPLDVRGKLVELTAKGVRALRDAMPLVIAVQDEMFGATGRAGGNLLGALREVEAAGRRQGV